MTSSQVLGHLAAIETIALDSIIESAHVWIGYIGKLKLQIPPVRYIKSQPWIIQIDQLYVVAGPAQHHTVSQ